MRDDNGRALKPDDASERVILVDEADCPIGEDAKLATHLKGRLHRAFSVFLFDRQGRTLLQKRADVKYHSRGKWANACCGHPRPGEDILDAARRRTFEELGIDVELGYGFQARYRAELDGGMVENELVHVFSGMAVSTLDPHPDEVSNTHFINLDELQADSARDSEPYSAWLCHYLDHHFADIVGLKMRMRAVV